VPRPAAARDPAAPQPARGRPLRRRCIRPTNLLSLPSPAEPPAARATRQVYDTKGRFVVHRISKEEASYKLCKVRSLKVGKAGVPHITTHDGRTLRYPDPEVKVNDTVMLDIESGKVKDFIKFDVGNLAMTTGGHNNGRVGTIVAKEKHKGSFDVVHIEDAAGNRFATRQMNVFVIGKGSKPMVSLPKGKGIRLTILQEQAKRYAA